MDSGKTKCYADRISGLIVRLVFFLLLVLAFCFIVRAFTGKNKMLCIAFLLQGVFFAVIDSLIFIKIYLPDIASSFANGLLMPKAYLSNAPLILTPFEGLISAGEYQEAEKGLLLLHEQYPFRADIVELLVRIYEKDGISDKMYHLLETFFQERKRPSAPENTALLLRFTDLMIFRNELLTACSLLAAELNSHRYTKLEKKLLNNRLNRVRASLEGVQK